LLVTRFFSAGFSTVFIFLYKLLNMSAAKPTIIIAHGAWQSALDYQDFTDQLKSAGYPVEISQLPSVGGTSDPLPGLDDDVSVIRGLLAKATDEGKEVILLMHSYGGVVGSCAVEGFDHASRAKEGKTGGVTVALYMSAFMIPKGATLFSMLGGQPPPWMNVQVCTFAPES
jgi:alpha-beta hydrolase superfamily lysophospholipase